MAGEVQGGNVSVEKEFIVMYVRVTDDKTHGMQFKGPFIGPRCPTIKEAEVALKSLTNSSRNGTIIPKIYPIRDMGFHEALAESKKHFDKLEGRMREAEAIISRPRRKKKKR